MSPLRRFEDKVVLITGAASGIGRASVERIAGEGGTILCADVQADAVQESAKRAVECGGTAEAVICDVGDPELSRYRTVLCNPAEGFFFAPMNFNYHAEHHLYTGIPYHQLPRCHALLSEHPRYPEVVEVERGYLSFLFNKLQKTAA